MFQLKPLTKDAIPAALEKAIRYRLLGEPGAAESICLDVLRVEPENQQALVSLLLALTDRFGKGYSVGSIQVEEVLAKIQDPYEQKYYHGLICERRAKAQLHQGTPGAGLGPMNGCKRQCGGMRKQKPFVRPGTTTHCCAGTPARASSWATS